MKNTASLSQTQRAVETVLGDYDRLRESGAGHLSAVRTVASVHDVDQHKIAVLVNDRDFGVTGNSGETRVGVVSTPSATHGTALPEWQCPDFVPVDL